MCFLFFVNYSSGGIARIFSAQNMNSPLCFAATTAVVLRGGWGRWSIGRAALNLSNTSLVCFNLLSTALYNMLSAMGWADDVLYGVPVKKVEFGMKNQKTRVG